MKRDKWNEKDDLLNKAIDFASLMHAGQFRKGTDLPYIVHPMEVLSILTAMSASMDIMIAGVLHDTVEDTEATIEDIKVNFGDEVAALVEGHTEDKSKSWEERKSTAIKELKTASHGLRCLILADKLSNMRAIARDYRKIGDMVWDRFARPKEKQSWYYSESIDALDGMQDDPDTAPFYWELNELYKEVFVTFYYSETARELWQKAVGEDVVYHISDYDTNWSPYVPGVADYAEEIPVKMAERIEDNWNERIYKYETISKKRQLTRFEVQGARDITMYNDHDMYVTVYDRYAIGHESTYHISPGTKKWEISDKLDEYMESELMMTYLQDINPDEAVNLLISWGVFEEENKNHREENPLSK